MKRDEPDPQPVQLSRKRLLWGIGTYITGQLTPLTIPLVAALPISSSLKATVSGLIFFGVPPLFTFSAIAILGKDGFNYLKGKLFAFLKKQVLPGPVSKGRYYTGLGLFILPLLLAWLTPYLSPVIPFLDEHEIAIAIFGDVTLIVSLLVLGGEFWEKMRGLFIYQPEAMADVSRH